MTRSIGSRGDVRLDAALVLTVLCSLLAASRTYAADPRAAPARTPLVVRVYDGAGVAARDLHQAGRVASDILRVGGVDVHFKDCPRSSAGPDVNACRRPLASNEVVLRVIPAATSMSAEPASLGFTVLDRNGRRPVLSTVFMDRVVAVARRAKIDVSVLTGRAMAHELGHVLLRTSGHAPAGLMRAFWSDDTLRSRADADWLLLPAEVDAIMAGHSRPAEFEVTGGS